MRAFLTGGTGVVGAGVARALVARGHEVVGLARSAATAERLRAVGVEPLAGSLDDADALRAGAAGADVVVQAAFPRDAYARLDHAVALDRLGTSTLVDAVAGTPTRLLYTSGIGVVGAAEGAVVDDATPVRPPAPMRWRRELELAVLGGGGIVLRPVFTYGPGLGALLGDWARSAAERGETLVPAPADRPWPAVHADDLGDAFALAAERAPGGTALNVSAGETTARRVAAALARRLGHAGAREVPMDEAEAAVPRARWIGGGFSVRADDVRDLLGWSPSRPSVPETIALAPPPA